MAFSTTAQTLYDGLKTAVVQITGSTDIQGDPIPYVGVDASQLLSPLRSRSAKVTKITYAVKDCTVDLLWDSASEDRRFASLSGAYVMDFAKIGGAPSPLDDGNGNIIVKPVGMIPGSSFSVLVELRK